MPDLILPRGPKMKRNWFIITSTLLILLFIAGCDNYTDQPPAPTSIPLSNPQDGRPGSSSDLIPPDNAIYLPEGFTISVFADGLTGPTKLALGPEGMIYVVEPKNGRILRLPDRNNDGIADGLEIAADDFIDPSSLAFYKDDSMYVAETTRVIRLEDPDGDGSYQDREIQVAGIAAGGNTERTLIFSPDWELFYLSIGSSCNVCREQDPRRATVMRFKSDGSNGKIITKGLRHVVGLAFTPNNDILWVTNIERDGLGDTLPPETLYAIFIDADAGWPYCHAGRIIDPDLGGRSSCDESLLTPAFELEAHSVPTSLLFYSGNQFPDNYLQDLFVVLHGSGEGESSAGYKIIRIPLGPGDDRTVQDFAVGWLLEDGTHWGTPADVIVGADGSLYVSDDMGGIIYRISYNN